MSGCAFLARRKVAEIVVLVIRLPKGQYNCGSEWTHPAFNPLSNHPLGLNLLSKCSIRYLA